VVNPKIITGWWCNFTILKNDGVKVNGKDDIPYMKWKLKKSLKPPTSCICIMKNEALTHQKIGGNGSKWWFDSETIAIADL